MSESTNVTPITGGKPPRALKQYELPKAVSSALWEQQERIYEALGAAEMLAYFVRDPPFGKVDLETVSNAANALVRLLKPIGGLTDSLELMRRGKEILGESSNG